MRVFIPSATNLSRAMSRVELALCQFTPAPFEVTRVKSSANTVVIHVVGYDDTVEAVEKCRQRGQDYVLIQYCLRTTQRSSCADWLRLWEEALAVWSYYDLVTLAAEDGVDLHDVNFYHAPMGVNSERFCRGAGASVRYQILTSGYLAVPESIREVAAAALRVGGEVFHLGPQLQLRGAVTYGLGLTDEQLANVYRQCRFVSGLRRVEGFELPAAEGLLCGARPILYDRPHYRRWFEPWGRFIREGTATEVEDSVHAEFVAGPGELTSAQLVEAADRFEWRTIVRGLWESLR